MTGTLDRLDRFSIGITRKIASIGVLVMLIIALLTVADITMRWLFSKALPGFNEIVELSMAVAIAATFPAGVTTRVNLTIDILDRQVSPRTRKISQAVGSLFLLVLFALLAYRVGVHALRLHDRNAISLFLEIPESPFMVAVSILLALAAMAQLVVYLQDLKAVCREKQFALVAIGSLLLAGLVIFGAGALATFYQPTALDHAALWMGLFFIALWVLVLGFVPVAAATGLTGLLGNAIFLGNGPGLSVLGSETADYLGNIQLAILPLFLLMGGFASQAGLASDVYKLAHTLLGRMRGGLAMATIGGCAGFGAMTGSSIATAATIGQVALPEMRSRGYAPGFSAGCVAAGGTLGQLVPPSTAIILYAILTEQSIGQLYIAAVIPALLAVAAYMITIKSMVAWKPDIAPATPEKVSMAEIREAGRGAIGVMLLFGVVIGGLYGGVFTATESAAVGAGGAFLFALFRGKLKGPGFWEVMASTTGMTAMIFLLIIGAVNFSFFVAISGLPELLTAFLTALDLAPLIVIGIFLVIYILLGSVMDPFPIMVITVPIVAPIIGDMGYDLVWWGIIMLCVVETGMITPPFGINVFVLKRIAGGDVPLPTVFKGVLPFVAADLIKLAILVLFPALVLWLPSTM